MKRNYIAKYVFIFMFGESPLYILCPICKNEDITYATTLETKGIKSKSFHYNGFSTLKTLKSEVLIY